MIGPVGRLVWVGGSEKAALQADAWRMPSQTRLGRLGTRARVNPAQFRIEGSGGWLGHDNGNHRGQPWR
jgi:hypothetical protein